MQLLQLQYVKVAYDGIKNVKTGDRAHRRHGVRAEEQGEEGAAPAHPAPHAAVATAAPGSESDKFLQGRRVRDQFDNF